MSSRALAASLGVITAALVIVMGSMTAPHVAGHTASRQIREAARTLGAPEDLAFDAHSASVVVHSLNNGHGLDHPVQQMTPREREILGDARAQVVAHHEHVEMLGDRVDGVRPRRVGR